MSIRSFLLATALVAPLAAIPVQAAEIQITATAPVIELNVTESVQAKPDIATVGAGVTTRAMTANDAARQNAARMDQVIKALRNLKVAPEDIQTSNFSVYPQFQYNNDGKAPIFIGYDVTNQVTVKLRDVKNIGPALDALIAVGANNFNGPAFGVDNDTAPRAVARKAAFATANARAKELAAMAGYRDVKLLEVSETFQQFRGYAGGAGEAIAVTASRADMVTPIQPGQVGISAQLVTKYEMVR